MKHYNMAQSGSVLVKFVEFLIETKKDYLNFSIN